MSADLCQRFVLYSAIVLVPLSSGCDPAHAGEVAVIPYVEETRLPPTASSAPWWTFPDGSSNAVIHFENGLDWFATRTAPSSPNDPDPTQEYSIQVSFPGPGSNAHLKLFDDSGTEIDSTTTSYKSSTGADKITLQVMNTVTGASDLEVLIDGKKTSFEIGYDEP